MKFDSQLHAVMIAGLSNLISTLVVILLYGNHSKNWFLLP